jgi:hypothetical protein
LGSGSGSGSGSCSSLDDTKQLVATVRFDVHYESSISSCFINNSARHHISTPCLCPCRCPCHPFIFCSIAFIVTAIASPTSAFISNVPISTEEQYQQ